MYRHRFIFFCMAFVLLGCGGAKISNSAFQQGPQYIGVFKVFDSRALSVFDLEVEPEVLADGFSWSEGPLWVSELKCLLFSDIPNNKVLKFCPKKGVSTYLADSGKANGLAINQKGELVLMRGGPRNVSVMAASLDDPQEQFTVLADNIDGKKLNSPNDLAITSGGEIFFTDPPYELKGGIHSSEKELAYQGVFYLNARNDLSLFDDDITWPNGLALSLDERTLFLAVSDPEQPVWYKYTLGEDGRFKDKVLFYDARSDQEPSYMKGLPDGLKVHSSGTVLATGPGGVWAFSESGELLARLLISGRPVANLALDSDEQYMYMTANDQLLRIKLR